MKHITKLCVAILLCAALVMTAATAEVAKGSRGDEVVEIQQMLANLEYLTGKVDGDFGGGTEKAVKAFQAAEGLEETGVVDDETRALLNQRDEERAEALAKQAEEEAAQRRAEEAAVAEPTAELYESAMRAEPVLAWGKAAIRIYSLQEMQALQNGWRDGYDLIPRVVSLSWTEDIIEPIPSSYVPYEDYGVKSFSVIYLRDDLAWAYEQVENGKTVVLYGSEEAEGTGNGYLFHPLDIILPDDPSIAGEQTVVLELCEFKTVEINVTLDYMEKADISGNHWDIEAKIKAKEGYAFPEGSDIAIPEPLAQMTKGLPRTIDGLSDLVRLDLMRNVADNWDAWEMCEALLTDGSYTLNNLGIVPERGAIRVIGKPEEGKARGEGEAVEYEISFNGNEEQSVAEVQELPLVTDETDAIYIRMHTVGDINLSVWFYREDDFEKGWSTDIEIADVYSYTGNIGDYRDVSYRVTFFKDELHDEITQSYFQANLYYTTEDGVENRWYGSYNEDNELKWYEDNLGNQINL